MNNWIKNTGVKPDVGDNIYEVRLRSGEVLYSVDEHDVYDKFDWTLEDSTQDIEEWRFVE